jgi:peptide/nickel transport system ATP-binding protein
MTLEVEGLRVELTGGATVVEDVSFSLAEGETLGLVGESGSGKTTVALALLGMASDGMRVSAGTLRIGDQAWALTDKDAFRPLRGRMISYVPQNPASSLNPSMRIGAALEAMLRAHPGAVSNRTRIDAVLRSVQLPSTPEFLRRYPHQLSGGQAQRLAIGIALVSQPQVIVMDEPTTGLDIVTQSRIVNEIRRLRTEQNLTIVYVSHDLSVVAALADQLAVMYGGHLVEAGRLAPLVRSPRHPYTRGLIASIPELDARAPMTMPGVAVGIADRPTDSCVFIARCAQRASECEQATPPLVEAGPGHRVRCVRWQLTPPMAPQTSAAVTERRHVAGSQLEVIGLRAEHTYRGRVVVAAHDVSFSVAAGECLALVGESGSGKTTIARCIAGLHPWKSGSINFEGDALAAKAANRSRDARRRLQIIFQNPQESLNPRHTVAAQLIRPARLLQGLTRFAAEEELASLLDQVRLPRRVAARYPAELSGGERQRVAIARALAAKPEFLICDEITSALDVSVQAAILQLLNELRDGARLGMLFISHDLAVVASVADRAVVLRDGVTREEGRVHELLTQPTDTYTQELVAAARSLPSPVAAAR